MDPRSFADIVMNIADKFNLSTASIPQMLVKISVISLKFVDRESLWKRLFDTDYVDWDLVKRQKDNVLGNCSMWIMLLDMFDWRALEKIQGEILLQVPMLAELRKQLRTTGLDPGNEHTWTMICKLKILMLLLHIPTLQAIDMLTCNVFKRSTTQSCMQLLALQSEHPYTPEEQEDAFFFIFNKAIVNTTILEQNIIISKSVREENRMNLQMSRLQVAQTRPRLRDLLDASTRASTITDEKFNVWETYTGFCYKHQFPPTLSENIKSKLYFMACQTRFDWKKHLPRIAPGSALITQKVSEYPVSSPEIPVLINVIKRISMEGQPPFAALNQFRSRCFQGFPISHVNRMTVTQFLHLYLSVYQNQNVWKELWKHFVGVISVQIMKDCESFVSEFPIDEENVLTVL